LVKNRGGLEADLLANRGHGIVRRARADDRNPPDQIRRLALELAKGEIERKPGEAGARREGASPRKKKGKGKGKEKEKFRNREAATRDRAEA
jgi:hypothetical protein